MGLNVFCNRQRDLFQVWIFPGLPDRTFVLSMWKYIIIALVVLELHHVIEGKTITNQSTFDRENNCHKEGGRCNLPPGTRRCRARFCVDICCEDYTCSGGQPGTCKPTMRRQISAEEQRDPPNRYIA